MRFWGWKENYKEVAKDRAEMKQLLKENKPLYGKSEMDSYMQLVAANNSRYSALKFSIISIHNLAILPWFNFVNHFYHGVDPKKYED